MNDKFRREVRCFMRLNTGEYKTATELAEAAAWACDHHEWLDDPDHEIWDWALEFIPGD